MAARDTAASSAPSPALDAAETEETAAAVPVYDERGNVRPYGTKGAKPMSYEERVAIAKKLGAGEIVGDAQLGDEPDPRKVDRTARAARRRRTRKASAK